MTRYPLSWPAGWKRTDPARRTSALFHRIVTLESSAQIGERKTAKRILGVQDATARVLGELRLFGVLEGEAIISTNVVLRLDGLPRSGQAEPNDPGVAVYWKRPLDRATKCMAIDRYDRVADNLAAIAATLEAMRSIERHGGAQILDRAFSGFDALPAPGKSSGRGWREILGFAPDATPDRPDVEHAYRRRRSEAHPDRKGGSAEEFDAVQRAYDMAVQEIGR